ncbi:MAG TPA: S46 family peptidase [Chitinophagaceae bacterium]|nr:S46 family peptidase [Chitinophagaceae bacterium]MCC6635190.1 S46 family peptidase [Chitinophagaceae bacterium]HNM34162.1 S46 family peptidase [Chitinophagaceae bacterium]HNN31666.1 S46 family peptidase [Chitinophagaceae bacterium]
MKKIIVSLVFALTAFRSYADEGMWLPMLLGQQVYKDMVKKGLKLKPEQLYSINKSSIKDAIIIFGGGCTGEIVSNQGLIFTNHHCGYGAIATASTVEANYLRDGFWAADKSKEISTNLSVKFLNRIEDVTEKINAELKNLSGAERDKKYREVVAKIVKEIVGTSEFKDAVVASMFKGNQFFVFVYDVFKDIRLVGTPQESIGKFGGDTDNWEWPRHTGDFSVFRVYTNADGSPANYNANNIPLKPKYHLPVSIKGIKDGDYSMIFGYPGGTNRYETSYGVKLATDINNPSLVALRAERLKYMYNQMKNDAAVKLQLASRYASIANYWKFFDGETRQLLKFDTYGAKQKDEAAFIEWAKDKAEYKNIFSDYEANYNAWTPFAKGRQYLNEGIFGSPLVAYVSSWASLERRLARKDYNPEEIKKAMDAADKARKKFLEDENKKSDQQILATVVSMFYSNIDKSQHPKGFYEDLFNNYNDIEQNPYKMFAADVFENTMAFDDAKWKAFMEKPSAINIVEDPAYKVAKAFISNYSDNYAPKYTDFVNKNNDLGRLYMKGLFEMNPTKMNGTYPDANFTMRVSYGNVKSYKPKDAVTYDYYCTLAGTVAKYKKGDYEFDLPAKLLELYKNKDFGDYADKKLGDIVVNFITTNDITGGNSGSPVIDAKGNLIGLAFDGNSEALSHKLAFDKELNRTICVDVRYVLWCIEKVGGAKHIIDELTLVK